MALIIGKQGSGSNIPKAPGTGTGLRLLSRSIEIMNQFNRRAATLEIQNLTEPHHGTRIVLLIPLTSSFRF